MRNVCDHCDYKVLLTPFLISTNFPSMRNGCDHCDFKVLSLINRSKKKCPSMRNLCDHCDYLFLIQSKKRKLSKHEGIFH